MSKILIIDDDPDIVESMRVVLEGASYEVVSAASGQEGLEKAKQDPPDLVILDIMMETRSKGLEMAQQFKEDARLSSVPILMLTSVREKTGFSFKHDTESPPWLPVDEYCEKPLKPEVLLGKVKKLLPSRP